jgi:hypothetical protein
MRDDATRQKLRADLQLRCVQEDAAVGTQRAVGGVAVSERPESIEWGASVDLAGLHTFYRVEVDRIASERAARVTRRFLWMLVVGGLLVAYLGAL